MDARAAIRPARTRVMNTSDVIHEARTMRRCWSVRL
jgi:hypothetical protein